MLICERWDTEWGLDWERVWWAATGYQEPGESCHRVTYNQTLILGSDWSDWPNGGLSLVSGRTWKSVTDQTCRQLVTIININSQFHQLPISRCQLSGSDQGKSVHNERRQMLWCVSLWSRSGQCGFILSWWMNYQTTGLSCNFLMSPLLSIMSGWYKVPKNTFL